MEIREIEERREKGEFRWAEVEDWERKEQREERIEKMEKSEYNRWYKQVKGKGIPGYLKKGWKEDRWRRIASYEQDTSVGFYNPIKRSKIIKTKLWLEVSDSLKGAFTPDGAKKKFKALTDTFRKIIRDEQCPSGSARKNNGNKWAHYDSMQFLRDHFTPRESATNCESEENDSDDINLSSYEVDNDSVKKTAEGLHVKGKILVIR
ncbi:uncharacterized protein LOC114944451 [Nylanderia fulva]|uniref:uncharacterized protein LOC114944451 n=1 Tax=Nylanderia fulva TaxID=613905 RepID=UPI0010FBAA7F|nr:uncharacterized protein LOC114944451 [Nylanderia fulva]